MEDPPKRKRTFRQEASRKKSKNDDAPSGSFSGLGAKLMAKMGYSGGGLGAEGQGVAEPIAVKLRATRAGLGAMKEKTDQQKREEKRKAELNGEKYEDSSEEERMRRKKKKAPTGASTGASAPGTPVQRPKKPVFATFRDAGLEIPPTLQSIVDAASGESKATSSLSLRATAGVPFQTPFASRVQKEMSAFAQSVETVQQEAKSVEEEMERLVAELASLNAQAAELEDIRGRFEELTQEKSWSKLVDGLLALQAAYPSKLLHREAVAVLHGPLSKQLADWDVAHDPLEQLATSLRTLRPIIDPHSPQALEYQQPSTEVGRRINTPLTSIAGLKGDQETSSRRSTPYQSMMLSWWTSFHSAMIADLDVDGPSAVSFIYALEIWKPVLPAFIFRRATTEIKRRIASTLEQWNPRKAIKHKSSSPFPQWIFQWLPYDPDIFSAVKSKLRTVLDAWPLHRGLIPGIQDWKQEFPGEMDQLLVRHLLPRLAAHLRDDFEMDPGDQKMDPITTINSWCGVLSPRIIAELLHAEFFAPKLYPCLHSWLTFEGRDLNEIKTWLAWWKDVFPKDLARISQHAQDWAEADKLIDAAVALTPDALSALPLPVAEPVRALSPQTPNFSKSVFTEPPSSARQEIPDASYKDLVEAWCADESLLFIPLRKADDKTGAPLFRITASATGKGGVVVYFRGDMLYAQGRKDRSVWNPVLLDQELVARAEGN